jgi:two-component system, NarL family, sensor kinase
MQTEAQLILNLILVFSFVLLLLAFFFFILIYRYNKNLKIKHYEALNNLLIGQLNERERLARDLHDSLNPQLSAINLKLDTIQCNDDEFGSIKTRIRDDINQAVVRIRQISHNLMPTNLKLNNLHFVFKDYIINAQTPEIQIKFTSEIEHLKFNEIVKFHLFYILMELIQNTSKHSKANKIEVQLKYNESKKTLYFNYLDNGIGIEEDIFEKDGIGIKNIVSRLKILNADFKLNTDNEFQINISIRNPINP